ncbi:MAG: insulinase family protein, partial [Spirochaetales bacterium]
MTDGIRRVLCLGAMLFLLPQASSYGEPAAGFDFLKKNVQTRTLGNGISVIALNRGYSPTLALIISFRVGSSDESYQTAGAAHMLEHMLFKGTDVIGTRDYKKEKKLLDEIEGIGEALDGLRISNPGDRRIPVLEKKLRKLENDHAKFVVSSPYDRIYSEIGGVGFNAATSRDQTYYFIEVPSGKLELWAQTESERLRNPVFREYYKER